MAKKMNQEELEFCNKHNIKVVEFKRINIGRFKKNLIKIGDMHFSKEDAKIIKMAAKKINMPEDKFVREKIGSRINKKMLKTPDTPPIPPPQQNILIREEKEISSSHK